MEHAYFFLPLNLEKEEMGKSCQRDNLAVIETFKYNGF